MDGNPTTFLGSLFQCLTVDIIDIMYVNIFFSSLQSKPPLAQPEGIFTYSITCYLEKRLTPTWLQPPFRQL